MNRFSKCSNFFISNPPSPSPSPLEVSPWPPSLLGPPSPSLPSPKRVKLSHMSTLDQMEAMRIEIKRKIGLLRDQLDTKECELLAEVDRLGDLQVRIVFYF